MALGSNDMRLVLKIAAETAKAEKDVSRFTEIVEGLSPAAKRSMESMIAAEKATARWNTGVNIAAASVKAISSALSLMKTGFDQATEGAKILSAEAFFKHSGKDIESYRKAVQGMVSDAELMKRANLADSMGIDEETFKQLAKVAQAAAQKTGQSFEYMFNSIVVGTARSSRLLLDNLGIIVSVEQANRNYAEANKTAAQSVDAFVESMTAEQKQLAFVIEVRKQSNKTLIEANEIGETAIVKFEKLSAKIDNMTDSWKKMLTAIVTTELGDKNTSLVDYFKLTFDTIAEDADGFLKYMLKVWKMSAVGGPAGFVYATFGGGALGDPDADYADKEEAEKEKLKVSLEKLMGEYGKLGFATGDYETDLLAISQTTKEQINNLEESASAEGVLISKIYDTVAALGYLEKRAKGGSFNMEDTIPKPKEPSDKEKAKAAKAAEKRMADEARWAENLKKAKQKESDDLFKSIEEATREGDQRISESQALDDKLNKFKQTEITRLKKSIDDTVRRREKLYEEMEKAEKAQLNAVVTLIGGLEALVEGGFTRENLLKVAGGVATALASAADPILGALVGLASAIVQATADYFARLEDAFRTPGTGLGRERGIRPRNKEEVQEDILAATGWTKEEYEAERDAAWWQGQQDQFNTEVGRALDSYYARQERQGRDKMEGFVQKREEAKERALAATEANTQALRDLAREFRNMPSGYKTQRAIYDASAPTTRASGTAVSGVVTSLDSSVLDSVWRNREYG